jgi:hypothetical protein
MTWLVIFADVIKTFAIRAAIFIGGFSFVAGATPLAFAWFTVDIPDPNAYVNSQSTIIQYSNGAEDWSHRFTEQTNYSPFPKFHFAACAMQSWQPKIATFIPIEHLASSGIARAILNNVRSEISTVKADQQSLSSMQKSAFLHSRAAPSSCCQ